MNARTLLSAWRRGRTLSDREASDLRALLLRAVTLPRRGWHEAVRHDHPRVVGVAIRYAADRRLNGPAADVVFSAVMLRARKGDPAAALVLDHARRRRTPPRRKGSA